MEQNGRQLPEPQRRRGQVIEITRNPARLAPLVVNRFERGKTVRELGREFGIPEREAEAHIRQVLLMRDAA